MEEGSIWRGIEGFRSSVCCVGIVHCQSLKVLLSPHFPFPQNVKLLEQFVCAHTGIIFHAPYTGEPLHPVPIRTAFPGGTLLVRQQVWWLLPWHKKCNRTFWKSWLTGDTHMLKTVTRGQKMQASVIVSKPSRGRNVNGGDFLWGLLCVCVW